MIKEVCIVGGGNAGHALAALLPFKGFKTTMYCPFMDEAERLNKGIKENDGMHAKFASHLTPSGDVKGTPYCISKDPADVIPKADLIMMPLPSFAYTSTLSEMKEHLQPGQIVCVTPGQGGFDWFAKEALGEEVMNKVTLMGLMPMPFNCRIDEFGKSVSVQQLKTKYSIGVRPHAKLPQCIEAIQQVIGGTAQPAGSGTFLECTMYPINAIIHPARLYTLLNNWKPGDTLAENPLFYEDMTPEAAKKMDEVNKELIAIGQGLTSKGCTADIPHIFDWLSVYVYSEPKDSNLQKFFSTNEGYKGFRCPLIPAPDDKDGFVPNFKNRYFTEDINLGLCGYKGLADIAEVETPVIDTVIEWAQQYMGKEFIVDGALKGKDLGETNAPQRFGINTIKDLKQFYEK